MALLERFAYFLVSRQLDFDTDAMLDTVTLIVHRGFFARRRCAASGARRSLALRRQALGWRATACPARAPRARGSAARGRSPCVAPSSGIASRPPISAARGDADERGDHRRRRREAHRAADDQRLQHVVLGLLVDEEDRRGRSPRRPRPGSARAATNGTAPRKPPIWGIGLQIATHTASSGARGTPSDERRGEHDDPGERGHEQRARDVAPDDVVDEPADPVGVGVAGGRARAAGPMLTRCSPSSTSVIASSSVKSAAATPSAIAPAASAIGVEFTLEALRDVVEPLLHLLRRVGLAQPRTDDRQRAELLDGLAGSPC